MPTNSDGTMPFKQNSDLFWLTGIDQEESVFAIVKKNEKISELLFVKETNEHIAIWEGAKLSKELATKNSGVQSVFWLSEMEKILSKEISEASKIYLNKIYIAELQKSFRQEMIGIEKYSAKFS